MLTNAYAIVIIILVINIVYVSFSTIRMILTLKGRRYLAAVVSTAEVVVYILGLSIVLDNLDGIQNIIAYAVGFALGIITGSIIEERLALGYITVNVISSNPTLNFTERLREEGFGVTSWTSSGMDGDRLSMQILTPRKQEVRLYQIITEIDPRAFMVAYEPKHIQGGFWVKQVRRGKLFKNGKAKDQVLKDIVPTEKIMEDDEVVEEIIDDQIPINPNMKPRTQKPNVRPKL
ncbi:DUF2179 domain-containing protein [Pseudogracilibacillus auburnensis]|uniref:UPF0316 protein DFR56_101516 n=1 Tax=Pseudogracilibacillus auburnensis TaxID=1494959 RepID=A0A2V3W890_9BACI|nr:DUF2179 domain-containing protein [Pseudogracilibacillus auburnensis]MBO1001170.1 DUF2179 domain-containing protein [Pseudogracilibacillus auburnensis]PXW90603.1 uncharacterized protein YebE (UPF0316 family) [Pseudogracilibacillus auburnensis]